MVERVGKTSQHTHQQTREKESTHIVEEGDGKITEKEGKFIKQIYEFEEKCYSI